MRHHLPAQRLDKDGGRKPRADALRNRARLLAAARTVFSARGPDASLEAVARSAGVGIGTLYRHFPTRESLFEAVYRHEIEQLADLAERLTNKPEPVAALRDWLRAIVRFVATKRGMSTALALAAAKDSDLVSGSAETLTRAVDLLLKRAASAGEVRRGVSADDLLRAVVGLCHAHDQPGWERKVLPLLDVFIDGLRHGRAKGRTG